MNSIPHRLMSEEHLAVLARPHVEIPITHGPLRGPRAVGDSLHFGAVVVSGELRGDYQIARDYLAYGHEGQSGDETMHAIFMHLEDRHRDAETKIATYIDIHEDVEPMHYGNGDGTSDIMWSSRKALATADGISLSPAMMLGHEAIHAYHHATDRIGTELRTITPCDGYTNNEERATIARENVAAERLGEGVRRSHGAINSISKAFYKVRHATDRHDVQGLRFPKRAAAMIEKLYAIGPVRPRAFEEELEGRGPGWRAYVRAPQQYAKNLERSEFRRTVKYMLLISPGERVKNMSALWQDLFVRSGIIRSPHD